MFRVSFGLTAVALTCLGASPAMADPLDVVNPAPVVAQSGHRLAQSEEASEEVTPLSQCQSDMFNTQLALTMWFVDHEDTYPANLDALVPEYFVRNLYCPLAGTKAYIYEVVDGGKRFKLTCKSDHALPDGALVVTNDAEMEKEIRSLKPD